MTRTSGRQNTSKQRKKKARERNKRLKKARAGEARSIKGRMHRAGRSPLRECLISKDWRRSGLAQVVIARDAPLGIAIGLFLVDLGCLGVKNTIQHDDLTRAEYDRLLEKLSRRADFESCNPALAVRLVETGVRYAAELGFEPHEDYRLAKKMFGDIDPDACDEEIPCGRDGKPFYIQGPDDDAPAVLRQLEDRLGPDGFHFVMEEEWPDELAEDDWPGEDDPDPDERLWGRMRRTEGELVEDIGCYGAKLLGRKFLDRARKAFTLGNDQGLEGEVEGAFVPWALFNWTPSFPKKVFGRQRQATGPLAQMYWEENEANLDEFERRFLKTICTRPYSFYVVRSVDPGVSMDLRDLFTGAEYTVRERQASTVVEEGSTIFARVLRLDSVAIMVGCGSVCIPPRLRPALIDLREELAGGREALSEAELASHDDLLRERYFASVRLIRAPWTPSLQNTDGDPLVLCKLAFDLRCPPAEALSMLRLLAGGRSDDEFPDEATHDEHGELESAEFAWLEEGNRVHKSWTNTIIGHFTVRSGSLVVDVNSRARAARARGEVERLLGGRATYRTIEEETTDKLFAESRRRRADPETRRRREEERAALEADPEFQAHVARMMEAHWESWFETAIPMLAGQTPREAAKTPGGRERLDALLDDYASTPRKQDDILRPDIPCLRRELGI